MKLFAIVDRDDKPFLIDDDYDRLMRRWMFADPHASTFRRIELHTYDPSKQGVYDKEKQVVVDKDLYDDVCAAYIPDDPISDFGKKFLKAGEMK